MVANSPPVAHEHRAAPPVAAVRPVRGHPGPALAATLGYLLVLAGTAAAFIATRGGQWLDGRLVPRVYWDAADAGRNGLMQPALALLYLVEDPVVLGALIPSVILVGALNRRVWAGLAGVAALLCSAGGSAVLKAAVPRPDLSVAGSTAHNSFPSGHVAAATGMLLAFMLALPRRARWWLAAPGALAVSAVGAAAMIAGWHRFSDLLGGVALASASCCLAAAALALAPGAGRSGAGSMPAGSVRPAALVTVAGTAAVAVLAAALPVAPALALAIAAAGAFTVLSTAVTAAVLSVTRL